MRFLRAKGNASDSDRPVALQMKPEALNELPNSCSFSPSLSFAASVSLHLWIFRSLNSFYSTSGGAFTTSKPRESVSPSPNTLIQHPSTDCMNNPASSHSNLYSNQTGAQNLPAAKDTASLVMPLSHGRHDS